MSAPLDGLVVADFSRILAGPLITQNLADLGARVIKVEHPAGGDDPRTWRPPEWQGQSTYFAGLNAGKESVALDLRSPAGLEYAKALVGSADVVVENFRPGVMNRLGLGYDGLSADRPDLVYCSISAFGSSGPGAELPGVDLLIQAMAGWMHVTGSADGEATKVGMAVVDVLAGLYACNGILAALCARGVNGRGGHVEVSLFHAAIAGLVNLGSGHLLTGDDPIRAGNRHPSIAPYEPVSAADRPFILAAVNDQLFATTCQAIGHPDLIADPRFATNPDRRQNVDELIAELEAALAAHPAAYWVGILREAGVPVGDINSIAEAYEFAEQLGIDVVAADPATGFRRARSPISIDGHDFTNAFTPPTLDQHGDALRSWLRSDS